MSVSFVTGILALFSGLAYNKGYRLFQDNRTRLIDLRWNSRDYKPTREIGYTVKDFKLFEREEQEWNDYNEKRKYYYRLLRQMASDKGLWTIWANPEPDDPMEDLIPATVREVVSNGKMAYVPSYITIHKELKDMYREITDMGVSFQFRPGIDYISCLDWRKSIMGEDTRYMFERDYKEALNGTNPAYPPMINRVLILTDYGIENVSMDYKRFYKPEYV